jgi:hypothetical protein
MKIAVVGSEGQMPIPSGFSAGHVASMSFLLGVRKWT